MINSHYFRYYHAVAGQPQDLLTSQTVEVALPLLPAQFGIYPDVLKAAIGRFVDADMPTQSAALAYYMVFSLPPMLLIVLWTGELLYKEVEIRDAVFAEIGMLVGEEGARQLMGTLEGLSIEQPTLVATLVGIAVDILNRNS